MQDEALFLERVHQRAAEIARQSSRRRLYLIQAVSAAAGIAAVVVTALMIPEAMPEAELASFVEWNPINIGVVENNLGVEKGTGADDAEVTGRILTYLRSKTPTLMFVQFSSPDDIGEKYGFGTDIYLSTISTADAWRTGRNPVHRHGGSWRARQDSRRRLGCGEIRIPGGGRKDRGKRYDRRGRRP